MLSGPLKPLTSILIVRMERMFNMSHQLFKAELINNIALSQSEVLTYVKRIGPLICKITH